MALLKRLIEAYADLPEDGYARDDVLARASAAEKQQLRKEVAELGLPLRGNIYKDMWTWWERRGGFERTKGEIALDLNILLERLDEYFRHRPIRGWPVSGGEEVMAIGERWWATHASYYGRNLQPLSPRMPFPSLQRGLWEGCWMRASEWVRAGDAETALERVLESNRLLLGFCSLRGTVQTHFDGTGPIDDQPGACRYGFRANGVVPNLEAIEAELRDCLEWARHERIHVLVFPELCVPEACWERLRDEIARAPGSLCLVIPGSYHVQDGDGRWTNAAPAWVVADEVVEVARWEKLEPVEISTEKAQRIPAMRRVAEAAGSCELLVERIAVRSDVRVLGTPFGVIGVAICRDALHAPHLNRLLHRADHAFILSMNESVNGYFSGATQGAGRQYVTAAYYVNAAQCLHEGNAAQLEMAFWRLPHTDLDGQHPDVRYHPPLGYAAFAGRNSGETRLGDTVMDQGDEIRLWPKHGRMCLSLPIPKNFAGRRGG